MKGRWLALLGATLTAVACDDNDSPPGASGGMAGANTGIGGGAGRGGAGGSGGSNTLGGSGGGGAAGGHGGSTAGAGMRGGSAGEAGMGAGGDDSGGDGGDGDGGGGDGGGGDGGAGDGGSGGAPSCDEPTGDCTLRAPVWGSSDTNLARCTARDAVKPTSCPHIPGRWISGSLVQVEYLDIGGGDFIRNCALEGPGVFVFDCPVPIPGYRYVNLYGWGLYEVEIALSAAADPVSYTCDIAIEGQVPSATDPLQYWCSVRLPVTDDSIVRIGVTAAAGVARIDDFYLGYNTPCLHPGNPEPDEDCGP